MQLYFLFYSFSAVGKNSCFHGAINKERGEGLSLFKTLGQQQTDLNAKHSCNNLANMPVFGFGTVDAI